METTKLYFPPQKQGTHGQCIYLTASYSETILQLKLKFSKSYFCRSGKNYFTSARVMDNYYRGVNFFMNYGPSKQLESTHTHGL